ncbi:MAG: hypothetical protein AB1664_20065 [Thermodesulfobacteriota bacterium]
MFRALASISLCILWFTGSSALELLNVKGNIYYFNDDARWSPLTSFGTDHEPQVSPDHKTVVFVRDKQDTSELWLMDASGENQRVILKGRPHGDPKKDLSSPGHPLFSPDGTLIYFNGGGWATTCAVYVLDLKTKKTRVVTQGCLSRVVPAGKYAGHLIVSKRKYFEKDSPYYDYETWLVSREGKDLMLVEDYDQFLRDNP